MYAPVFELLKASPTVAELIGDSDTLRAFPFGSAPQLSEKPYVVWQSIGGNPENYINRRPDMDLFSVQVDCYAKSISVVRAVGVAVRDALESDCHITSWRGESYESMTGLYRFSFDCDFRVSRRLPTPPPTPPLTEYLLNDDGTLAAQFGFAHAASNAPDYHRVDYTYASPSTGNAALSLPSAANVFGSHAITVAPGKILAMEWVIHSVPIGGSSMNAVGAAAFTSNAGVPSGGQFSASVRRSGSGFYMSHTGSVGEPSIAMPAGLRIGMEFNGNNGSVRYMNSEGYDDTVTGAFTPGHKITFMISIDDNGITPAGNTASVEIIPAGADMTLPFTAGAVDVFNDEV